MPVSMPFPDPLHPAVVHFPIALLIVGAGAAVVAVVVRRWHLPWLAALLLVLGAAGAVVAVGTGKEEEEMVETNSAVAEQVLDEHEEWGETTRNLALAAALFAVAAAFASKVRVAGIGLSAVTAVLAMAAAYCVAQTGPYGGELVYRHGVGINTVGADTGTTGPEARSSKEEHEED